MASALNEATTNIEPERHRRSPAVRRGRRRRSTAVNLQPPEQGA